MINLYAENIGDFAGLFTPEDVTLTLLPLFYTLSKSRTAHIRILTAQNLSKMLSVYKEDAKMQEGIIEHIQTTF